LKVRKAVIIAAGKGTRFLPFTKSVPKEMLPLVDEPLLHRSVSEAVASGIEQIVIVTAPGKESMEHYFAPDEVLECFLEDKGDKERLELVRSICRLAYISHVVQEEQLGLGHAVLTAREAVGDEPFAVILPDDIYDSKVPALRQMLAVYEEYGANVVAVEQVSREDVSRYGVIRPGKTKGNIHEVLDLVEKPPVNKAPSRLAIVGRYVFLPEIFQTLAETPPGRGGEIQVTDGMRALLEKQKLYAVEIEGIRHDTGNPLGWLKANVAFAIQRDDMRKELREYLKKLLG
jgi:UTP--glucose-1-phosphate uridylyltransferase